MDSDRFDIENNIFLLPGPVKMHPRVIRAMCMPAISHRDANYYDVIKEIREGVLYLFQTKYDVCVFTGSGTSSMDAVLSNILNKEDKILCIHNGNFGERFFEIGKRYCRAEEISFEWGKLIDMENVKTAMDNGKYKAVTICLNESSTGMVNQGKEIGKIVKAHDALYIVDGITAVGGMAVTPEDIMADALVTASQKCLAAPAGLSTIALSPRYMESLKSDRPYYLDIKAHVDKMLSNDTPYTSAIPLFLAFREALRILREEGIENRISRTAFIAQSIRRAIVDMGLEIFPEASPSNTVTAVKYPLGIDDSKFRETLKKRYSVIIAGGQNILKGKIFRIGHMGIVDFNTILPAVSAIEIVLRQMGHRIRCGAGAEAIIEMMELKKS